VLGPVAPYHQSTGAMVKGEMRVMRGEQARFGDFRVGGAEADEGDIDGGRALEGNRSGRGR